MRRRKSNDHKQMWVTPNFRKCMYEAKATNPEKTLFDIQDEIAEAFREQKLKIKQNENKPFWGKL